MAGDWIPMRIDIADDPAVIAIAAATGLTEDTVVGKLHRLWSWANKHLKDGYASTVTDSWIDRYIGTAGFAAAMLNAGWLRTRSVGVEFPFFDRWNSKSAKNRVLSALRMRRMRDAERDDASVTNPQPEKRREEKSTDPPNPPAGGKRGKRKNTGEEHRHFAAFWVAYPRTEARSNAVRAFAKLDPDDALLAVLLAAIDRQRRSGGCLEPRTTADGRSTIPHPASWLNGKRWEDEGIVVATPLPAPLPPLVPDGYDFGMTPRAEEILKRKREAKEREQQEPAHATD